jgi:hypothetical protein
MRLVSFLRRLMALLGNSVRGTQLDWLAFEPSSRDSPAADHECQVFGRPAQCWARSIRPVKVSGLEPAPLEVDAACPPPSVRSSRTTRMVLSGERRAAPSGKVTSRPWITT